MDVLESNKNSNKDDIKRLRDENKELRQKYAQLQRVRISYIQILNFISIVPDNYKKFNLDNRSR